MSLKKCVSYDAKATYLYGRHKDTAKQRGIPFKFSLAEWVRWWHSALGPDWMSKRGRRRDQYVMARNNDQGAYEPGNVRCITSLQNILERNARCSSNARAPRRLSDDQVAAIYLSNETQSALASAYNVSQSLISHIKMKKNRRAVTDRIDAQRQNTL